MSKPGLSPGTLVTPFSLCVAKLIMSPEVNRIFAFFDYRRIKAAQSSGNVCMSVQGLRSCEHSECGDNQTAKGTCS